MKRNLKSILILVILCSLLFLYLLYSKFVVESFLDYTELFMQKFFPPAFIFMLLSNMLIEYNFIQIIQKYLKINSSYLYVFLLSLISGTPSGAIYARELYKKNIISEKDANNIIMFSHFPNPLFIITSVGSILGDTGIAIKILLSLILGNFIIYLFIPHRNTNSNYSYSQNSDFSSVLMKCINKCIRSIVSIYGISLFFFLISATINMHVDNMYLYILISGLFDLTKGVYSTALINNIFIRAILIIAFTSIGPLSIQMQVKSILSDTKINYQYFLIGRILGFILTSVIFITLYLA